MTTEEKGKRAAPKRSKVNSKKANGPKADGPVHAVSETAIVVCQCGCTSFNIDKQTKTSVTLACTKCGDKTSVKGPVALAQVDDNEVKAAIERSVVRPDPDYDPSAGKEKKPTLSEQGYTMLRFRVGLEAKENTIDRALECIRVRNCNDAEFKDQTWQGHALEYLCAEHLSGEDPQVIAIVDEMHEEADAAAKEAEEAGKKKSAVTRKVRETRQRVMERGAAQIGIIEKKEAPSAKPKQQELPPANEIDPDTIPDDGKLEESVKKTLIEFAEEYREDTGDTIGLLIGKSPAETMKKAERDGGFAILVVGDDNTRTRANKVPSICFWIEKEPADRALELSLEYEDAFDVPVGLDVIEIVPADFDNMDPNEKWEMPTFCQSRRGLE